MFVQITVLTFVGAVNANAVDVFTTAAMATSNALLMVINMWLDRRKGVVVCLSEGCEGDGRNWMTQQEVVVVWTKNEKLVSFESLLLHVLNICFFVTTPPLFSPYP